MLVLVHHLTWLAKLVRLPRLLLNRGHIALGVLLLLVGLLLGRLNLLHVVGLRLHLLHVTDALAHLELLLRGRQVIVAAVGVLPLVVVLRLPRVLVHLLLSVGRLLFDVLLAQLVLDILVRGWLEALIVELLLLLLFVVGLLWVEKL